MKPRHVRDRWGRVWRVLAEHHGWLWLAPKAPDDGGPWTQKASSVEVVT